MNLSTKLFWIMYSFCWWWSWWNNTFGNHGLCWLLPQNHAYPLSQLLHTFAPGHHILFEALLGNCFQTWLQGRRLLCWVRDVWLIYKLAMAAWTYSLPKSLISLGNSSTLCQKFHCYRVSCISNGFTLVRPLVSLQLATRPNFHFVDLTPLSYSQVIWFTPHARVNH